MIGYASNITNFNLLKCKYKYTIDYVASARDALELKKNEPMVALCYHVVDGDFERFEVKAERPARETRLPEKGGVSYLSVHGPENGSVVYHDMGSARFDTRLRAVNIYPKSTGDRDRAFEYATPLDYGFGHRRVYGPDVLLGKPDECTPVFLGRQQVDGVPLIGVRFDTPTGIPIREIWFDPARGYLPARIVRFQDSKPDSRYLLLDAKQVDSKRWFPMKVLKYEIPAGGKVEYRLIEVTELDVETRPKREELAMSVPAGTNVLFCNDPSKSFAFKQDEAVNAHDIPKLFEMVERSATTPLMDTAILRNERPRWWLWVLGVCGLVLTVAGGIAWHRKRRTATTG